MPTSCSASGIALSKIHHAAFDNISSASIPTAGFRFDLFKRVA
jgi:hypothetical protein